MCFFGFLRSGEVTVPSLKLYDPESHLSVGDVALDSLSDPSVVRVNIKVSKMDPFRRGVAVYLGKTGTELCPVAAVSAYLAVRGSKQGPFFQLASGTPLSRLRIALKSSGFDASHYSGHSFHIGAATTAASIGIADALIKHWEGGKVSLSIVCKGSKGIIV